MTERDTDPTRRDVVTSIGAATAGQPLVSGPPGFLDLDWFGSGLRVVGRDGIEIDDDVDKLILSGQLRGARRDGGVELIVDSDETSTDGSSGMLVNLPTVNLNDGEFYAQRIQIPSDQTLTISEVGVQTDENDAPAGLSAKVVDETNDTTLVSENSMGISVSTSKSGPFSASFRILNSTGSVQNASAYFEITKEQP